MSLEEWANAEPVYKRTLNTWLSRNPEAAEDLKEAFRSMVNGKSSITFRVLHLKLVELYDYPYTDSAMRQHLQRTCPELWEEYHGN